MILLEIQDEASKSVYPWRLLVRMLELRDPQESIVPFILPIFLGQFTFFFSLQIAGIRQMTTVTIPQLHTFQCQKALGTSGENVCILLQESNEEENFPYCLLVPRSPKTIGVFPEVTCAGKGRELRLPMSSLSVGGDRVPLFTLRILAVHI